MICAKKGKPQYGRRKLVCGFGVFDAPYAKTHDALTKKAYRDWSNMLQRCYGKSKFLRNSSYEHCSVCEEWRSFMKFREWFDKNYIEGYSLDKDILSCGNKIYSPRTCAYIPSFINTLLLNCRSARGHNPIGVYNCEYGYMVKLYIRGKQTYVGFYHALEDAFAAYKKSKEKYVQEVAQEYYNENKISKSVYEALMNYKVEITD